MSPQDLSQLVDFLRENLRLEVQPGQHLESYRPKPGGIVLKLSDQVLSELPISFELVDKFWNDDVRIRLKVCDQVVSELQIQSVIDRSDRYRDGYGDSSCCV